MRPSGLRFAALALVFAAGGATAQAPVHPAQAPGPSARNDVGFFRPAADPALTAIPPPQPVPAPQQQAGTPNETAQMAAAELAATKQEDAMRWAEQQMDRVQGEAERARDEARQAPPGVGAAFTGTTGERDR